MFILVSLSTNKGGAVKQSEFKRWLASQGVTFAEGSNHTKAYYQGKQTTLPRHPSKELKDGTRKNILKALGLK
ncbi:type II toxin-antitoxin system HicA family toxin [Achromobacter seleniivolatilans]|uniref:Type II toxin-antitoxin system HicA family toxin n=1 Tax=Achromobacter seleniivolatilans TaxID=3047478 RepID=A0ABY9M9I0_9BURK|nr:type II toxin-antitoxin system HicA family toxin [Achromobacter sp. R39]WMD23283.1 type II toxin-antitoxin system HicA family toxin [Achromobacter sp. R39]